MDMFPYTADIQPVASAHVETVVLLSKGIDMSKSKVRVEFSVEDMDLSAAHGKAPYPAIKKHVMESTGLHVSSLNIAQTKRKHGIIERRCYKTRSMVYE